MSQPQTGKPKKKKFPINRPNTPFAMKANLVQREPLFQQRWERLNLYRRLRDADHPRRPFVFHDGPPYANGDIHIGHLLNKVLKDLVVRSKLMAGHDVDFVPGWDCHGLPIEHRVMKELGDAAKDMDAIKVRRKCQAYAEKFVKVQSRQMQRLGTIGDYDKPYITMDPAYEAGVLEVFADLVEAGLVYRALKPVHWSTANQTALAEAELEYKDREDTSVYVLFPIVDKGGCRLPLPEGASTNLMIWTTTPWTLPANLAVAVAPAAEYSLFEYCRDGQTHYVILAEDLHKQVFEKEGLETSEGHKRLGTVTGEQLVGMTYQHPFCDRTSPVVDAGYVTLEDGTGLVHTAPGHGVEDYQTGLREGLDIYCPVQADGTFDETAPAWLRGQSVWEANDRVVEQLRGSGHLFHAHAFTHSYPHDWRSKTPVIFRATEQWFVKMDEAFDSADTPQSPRTLRDRALTAASDDVRFIPAWGRNRMRGMLENAPDWCISRQRSWGLPIPVFTHKYSGEALLTPESVRHVASIFRGKGSDIWFIASAAELLEGCPGVDDPDAWDKGADIFDVWFESGSSWRPVLEGRHLGYPADLYLEGSDQHRGWFQKALLTSLGATGQPCFRGLLTHGFMVDARGEKMSKSGGNAINVAELMTEHGADICRWWVASLSYANDIKVDWEFFRLAGFL
ncbi:MAG: isoleucine--tRNA ligase, partial [Phycisphaerae bacterium]|nr:isoleucine--tRNA ligase [Phycisphaerae bacterium]